ncbi:MAG TPA: tRNA 2-thiouridine(34) synthase MnmA [Tissierellaceae bacterium]
MKKKVVLGMSGGVDSSVAAYILQQQGYEVIGVTLVQTPHDEVFDEDQGGCCSISSVFDAKKVASDLNIPHYVINFRGIFERKVVNYFIDEYLEGKTPNPCLMCNKYVRFDKFLDKAKELGADYLATGHYARVEYDEETGRYLLLKSEDDKKDQTYFLHQIKQEQLSQTMFPLGGYKKEEIREIAEKLGMVIHDKPDSEEICFIPDNDHGGYIKRMVPDKVVPGNFIDSKGNILGQHKGIVYYTVGQRKGLGVALGRRVFVQSINPDTNEIVLGDDRALYKNALVAKDLNFISIDKLDSKMEVTTKIRHTNKESNAVIYPIDNDRVKVEFETPQRAIAKGQGVIFYNGDVVVGGGIIEESL